MKTYAGVDGCPAGWVVATVDERREFGTVRICKSFAEVVEATAGAELVFVDIPIGLSPERACDAAARRFLGAGRASSVFPVPLREAVHARDYPEGSRLNHAATGRKLSVQTWGIVPKIAEVDRVMRANPALQERIHESHPEVCFAALNGGRPMESSKKTPEGVADRLAVLTRFSIRPERVLAESRFPRKDAAADDLFDAMVCAVSAHQSAREGLLTLPPAPGRDEFGLRMEIAYSACTSEPTPHPDLRSWLGRPVTVTVDRPLASRHPEGHPIWYPVNYGYIPGTLSGDGEPLDAYLLGIFEPVTESRGVVIGVIHRSNDVEGKLVVAPPGVRYTAEQIEALVEFQERLWLSRVITEEAER